MSSSEHEYSGDERFERLLLDSARSDELPRDTDAAWQRFDSALRGVSLLAAGSAVAMATRKARYWFAAKWLIWGALAGSALTALSLRPRHERAVAASTPVSAPSALAVIPSSAAPTRLETEAPRVQATPAPLATVHRPVAHASRPHPSASVAPVAAPPSSTLAEQVALLDTARTAIASGASAEALRLADRYRAEFPDGQLAPEAEVVAIEALIARGSRAAASERADRFLARYPGDPHAGRVKRLVR